ncbi:MAG: alpha/beta fold hydrolase [Eubacterium sp.]|nr:alpha/beta fold hydrolase [Eubacterium sp.]
MDYMICFPHAGGSANAYNWVKSEFDNAGADIDVLAYEYAGHGRKHSENYYKDYKEAVNLIASDAAGRIDEGEYENIYIMGHSMGAYIALGVGEILADKYGKNPKAIFVSGQSSPVSHPKGYGKAGKEELIEYLKTLGGMEEEILCNPKYVDFFLEPVRADMNIIDTYVFSGRKLGCRLFAAYSKNDPEIEEERLEEWELATEDLQINAFEGGHFFLFDKPKEYAEYMLKRMKEND